MRGKFFQRDWRHIHHDSTIRNKQDLCIRISTKSEASFALLHWRTEQTILVSLSPRWVLESTVLAPVGGIYRSNDVLSPKVE